MTSSPRRKLALITGASAGIGAAFARAYAARGFDLALVARRVERLEALAADLRGAHDVDAFAIPADLAMPEAEAPVMASLAARGRDVDALVNNAGFGIPRRFADVDWADQRDFLMTMGVTPCALAHAVIPGMVARGWGRIINVASMAGYAPGVAGNTLYPGVKSLMIRFSQALDAEYRANGIKVTALCPGATESEFAKEAGYDHLVGATSRLFTQTAAHVVQVAIAANEAGRVVVIPGWHNSLAVMLMRALPESWVRSAINTGAKKYLLGADR
jgi:short-subunit dehydrogenase